MATQQLGWEKFSLLGHSLGGIISVLIAGAVPERVERVALIDGLVPHTGDGWTKKLGEALLAHISLAEKKKTIYASVEQSGTSCACVVLCLSVSWPASYLRSAD